MTLSIDTINLILLLLAFLCFLAAAFGKTINNINLVALGLAFWVLVFLISTQW